MEDNFPMEQRWGDGLGMIQVHYSQAHLLPHGPVPNRPAWVPVHGQRLGTLLYKPHLATVWGTDWQGHGRRQLSQSEDFAGWTGQWWAGEEWGPRSWLEGQADGLGTEGNAWICSVEDQLGQATY